MDGSLHKRAEQLATEFASQARTAEDLNGLLRLMMKSALERMLNTELDVHLGRRPLSQAAVADSSPDARPATSAAASGAVASPPAALAEPPQRQIAEDGPRRTGRTEARHSP